MQSVTEVKHDIQRNRGVDTTCFKGNLPIKIRFLNPYAAFYPEYSCAGNARRKRCGAGVEADSMAAKRLHKKGERAAGATTEIEEEAVSGYAKSGSIAAQIRRRNPGVLTNILAVGVAPKCAHQRRLKLLVEGLVIWLGGFFGRIHD